jgi:para-aminobenzoate synthetase component 1
MPLKMIATPFVIPLAGPTDPAAWAWHAARQHRPAWLDGDGGRTARGRFSFLAWSPHRVLRAWGNRIVDERWEAGEGLRDSAAVSGDPLEALAEALAAEAATPGTPPVPFVSGAILALGFELADWIERLPRVAADSGPHAATPDLTLAFYDSVLIFDEVEGRVWMAGRRPHRRRPSGVLTTLGDRNLAAAVVEAQGIERAVIGAANLPRSPAPESGEWIPGGARGEAAPQHYLTAIAAIREHLAAGDVYQVNLSRALRAPWPGSALDLFLAHRRRGRVPHGAFLDLGDRGVACFSPERFLACRGSHVVTCPIKGTRPRGATAAADSIEIEQLRASAKDRAEHIMIVDLERNDLGRVCKPGTVRVDPLLTVESYPSVHHLVSTVHGLLRSGAGPVDLIRATFPGGSITGAPKIRAIEILRALEGEPRRLYTGAIGYHDAGGDLDLAIAIRTALVAGGELEYRVGGGIVIDSDAESEYQETLDKARTLDRVLAQALESRAATTRA